MWVCRRFGGTKGARTVRAMDYNFLYGKGKENNELRTGFFVHHRIVSAIKRVEFVSDRMLYIVLRGRWCNIIVLNVHASSEEKSDDSKDSFYEELEYVFYHFPKYHMKTLLADFSAKLEREDIFKPTIGNESLHQDSNDNGVRIVHFSHKNRIVKSTMFPHGNFHECTWPSINGNTHKQIDHILIERRCHSCIFDIRSFRGGDCDHYLVVVKVRERLTVSKQKSQNFDVERFILRKLSEAEVRKQCQIKLLKRFAAMEDLSDGEDIKRSWENII